MTRKLLILTIIGLFVLSSLALATDLKWRSPIEISPAAPNTGDTVTFRCKLKSGGGPADSVLVEGRIDGVKVWDHTYPHFNTDEFTWVEFTWLATGGTHTVAFVVDPLNCTGDTNPLNNTRSISFNVTGIPPAQSCNVKWIGGLTTEPATTVVGSLAIIKGTFKVLNGSCENVNIEFKMDNTIIDSKSFVNLAENYQSTVHFSRVITASDTIASLHIIPQTNCNDTNTSDNVITRNLKTAGPFVRAIVQIYKPLKPDLVPELIISPLEPEVGKPMGITLKVTNNGEKDAQASELGIQLGQHPPMLWPVPLLKPGRHYSIMRKLFPKTHGIYYITGYADYKNDVDDESNENNNIVKTQVTLKAPDLKFTKVVVSRTALQIRQKVYISVTVKNNGNARSGPFNIQANVEPCKLIAQGPKVHRVHNGLAPGETVMVTFSHRFPCLRQKVNYVMIDPDNEIAEQDENNNATPRIVINVYLLKPKYYSENYEIPLN